LSQTLSEDDFSERIPTPVSQLAVEIEFELISDLATGHGRDVAFFHFCFYSSDVQLVVRLDLLVDLSCIWQLHPECLELFAIQVALGRQLQCWRCRGLSKASK